MGANSKRSIYRWMACSSSVFGCRKTAFRIHFSAAACLLLAPLAPPLKARLPVADLGFFLFIADSMDPRECERTANPVILRLASRFLFLRPEFCRAFTCFSAILFLPPPVDVEQGDYGAIDLVLGCPVRPHPEQVLMALSVTIGRASCGGRV